MPENISSNTRTHLHSHGQGDAVPRHYFADRSQKNLARALGLTLSFGGVEVGFDFWSNSLALISDAGHMVTDAAALGLALLDQLIFKRPPTAKNSFGFGRAEALAAVMLVASITLEINMVVAWAISHDKESDNTRPH